MLQLKEAQDLTCLEIHVDIIPERFTGECQKIYYTVIVRAVVVRGRVEVGDPQAGAGGEARHGLNRADERVNEPRTHRRSNLPPPPAPRYGKAPALLSREAKRISGLGEALLFAGCSGVCVEGRERTSRIGIRKPVGAPLTFGSDVKLRWVFAMHIGILSQPSRVYCQHSQVSVKVPHDHPRWLNFSQHLLTSWILASASSEKSTPSAQ